MMTDTLLNIITNARLKLLLKSNIITYEAYNQFTMIDLVFSSEKNTVHDTQVQDMNQSASEIKSSFNHHKAMFINNLSAILDLMTLKKNEYRSIKCLSANTSIFKTLFKRQDYDE